MPPHLNPLPKGRGRENRKISPLKGEEIIRVSLSLKGEGRVRVKLKHIRKRIPSNRITINLVLPLIMQWSGYQVAFKSRSMRRRGIDAGVRFNTSRSMMRRQQRYTNEGDLV